MGSTDDIDKSSSSIMFIADAAQSIYIHSWLSNQSFKSVGFDMSGKSNILSKNYRITYEIAQAAYSLIQKDNNLGSNDNFVEPTAIERHGDRPFFSEEQIPLGRKLVYVGMTRAKEQLYLTCAGKPCMYIDEMEHSLLRNSDTELASFYKVPIEEYCFKEKIQNINTREEMVRQWFIQELEKRWNYPLSLIRIEYPVQKFSYSGFVDIVVHTYMEGKIVPLILIETKQSDGDLERAMKQLQAYVSCIPSAKYAVVTDGWRTKITEYNGRTFTEVSTFPVFKENLANKYYTFTFFDLKKKSSYIYKINAEDRQERMVKRCDTEEIISDMEYKKVPVYGEVAAGTLHYAREEKSGYVLLPEEFLRISKECFLLKVSGDSMIDFGIDNGDMVVVLRQNYADIGDIVVAGDCRTNEATMKKYYPCGEQVTLAPGNNCYQPIVIDTENLFINGIVIGVLKQK